MALLRTLPLAALLFAGPALAQPLPTLDPGMQKVIDALGKLGPKPLPQLSAGEARQQPSAADAAHQVMREQGMSTLPDPAVTTRNILVAGSKGQIVTTLYTPQGATGPLPMIVYFHGGGFVIANNATYDGSARLLAKGVGAIVASVEYSKAPEHKFPIPHDDAVSAYQWLAAHAAEFGADPARLAVAGESAGGNLAMNVGLFARDLNLPRPKHLLVIYPMAGTDLDTESYRQMADAKPLNRPMMEWFYKNLVAKPEDMQDKRLDIVGKADFKDLPPVTLILDEVDPLRSEGEALGAKLKAAGAKVDVHLYKGVTHEFFGMGAVVAKAKEAETAAIDALKASLAK